MDDVGLQKIQIGFTEPADIPANSVKVWTIDLTQINNFTTAYDGNTDILTINFAQPIRDTRLNVLVNFTITDLAGNALDGEITNPAIPVLPSGDGFLGGQAVLRFNILQGDANRDGIVNQADAAVIRDSLGLDPNAPSYNPMADLNLDGAVNAIDSTIFRLAEGRTLQKTDGNPPNVERIFQPDVHVFEPFDTISFELSEPVVPLHLSEYSGYLIDQDGNLIVPTFHGQGLFGDVLDFFFIPEVNPCNTYTFNLTNGLADITGELMTRLVTPPIITGLVPPPAPTLNAHTTSTKNPTITVTGTAPGANTVEVSGPMGLFAVPVTNTSFTANVPLGDNRVNPVFFTSLSRCNGVRSPSRVTTITSDNQTPNLFIDFPADGATVTTDTTDVAGRVGDILSGYLGLVVAVEVLDQKGAVTGTATAAVNEGIGNNGTFFAMGTMPSGPNVSLNLNQQNTIRVTATDSLLNSTTKEITVTQSPIPAAAPGLVMVSGNGQGGAIGSLLGDPIVVQVSKQNGSPFANKTVTFHVSRSNGRLTASPPQPTDEGSMMLQVRADANGEARAWWRLGSDAGEGNNRVEVTSQSMVGTVVFCASATPGPVRQINIGMGNNQKAEAGGPAPEPLRAWVSDGCNGVPGQRVQFAVTRGGGRVNGLTSVIVNTGDTGHVGVNFTLGPDYGTSVVEARLVDYSTLIPARFHVYGLAREGGRPTAFSGIVMNNAGQPIQGVTVQLVVNGVSVPTTTSDIDGGFRFNDVPGSGKADLFVDGSTATHIGGASCTVPSCDVAPGTFPGLHFEMVVVPNAENSLTMPVMLPPLNPNNVNTTYSATPGDPDTILTVEGMEGLEMRVKAGSMKLAGGAAAPYGTAIYLNQVHEDAIPMPIPDGASPPFTWTLQPGGATFDPPIEITYPNMSGLPAGSIAYFLSYNHDTSRFEIIASGHVTEDGAYIVTDPGAGLSLAGWGCNCPPYSVTGECCTGCEGDCCEGACCCNACCADGATCCDGQCCTGTCCNGRCCADCCDGQCCSGECCDGRCCPAGKECCENGHCCADCCGGECCDGPCCEGVCCPEGGSCCVERCCDGPCCEDTGLCCGAEFKGCCGDKCCEGPCCEEIGLCCGAQFESCCNNKCCLGPCCEDGFGSELCCGAGDSCCDQTCCPGECCEEQCCPGVPCCDENGDCCLGDCCGENNDQCCEPGGECCHGLNCCPAESHCCPESVMGHCCPDGEECCGQSNCCPVGEACCDPTMGLCCGPGRECCGLFGGPMQCCEPGEICCDGECEVPSCSLTADPAMVCPGGTTDVEVVAICMPSCANMQIIAEVVELAYKPLLTVTVTPSSVGCGPQKSPVTATIQALPETRPGTATIKLTGIVVVDGDAACEVTTMIPVTIDPTVDLNIDSNNDGVISAADNSVEANLPGKVVLVNDDDDNSNGIPDLGEPGGFVDDELVALAIIIESLPPEIPPGSYWRLDFPSSVMVYGSPDRTAPIQQGVSNPLPAPPHAYVEAHATSLALGDVTIVLTVSIGGAAPCADLVRVTALELAVDVSGDIDADTHESSVSAIFSPFFEPDLSEAVEGLPVAFTVRGNDVGLGEQAVSINEAAAALGFMTSTTPGDQYNVETRFFDARRRSEYFSITPGQPATVSEQVLGSLVADGTGTITVIAELRDQYGNAVADGTSLEWMLTETTGLFQAGSVETITKGGQARAVAVASAVPTTQVLSILSAPMSRDVPIPVSPVSGSLAGPSSLDIAQQATGVISLSTNAADGTPVYWTLSNGNMPFAETVVAQGTSAIAVSAAKAPFNLSRVGPYYVTAAVGDRLVGHQIDFVSSAPFYTEISRFVLGGDATTDGFYTYELPNVQEIPGYPPLVPTTFPNVPFFSRTSIDIHGVAGGAYIVSLVDKNQAPYLTFSGLDPDNRVTLDLNGVGTFELRSTGNFDGVIPDSNFLHVSVRVSREGAPTEALIEVVPFVELPWWAHLTDGVSSFVGGDPKTPFGFAANVAGGMLVVGDVGSIVKNAWLALPFTEGDPNALEAMMSGLGLATELAVGVGEAADLPISGVRAIAAAIGQTSFTEAMVILLKRAITNAQKLPQLASFVAQLITDPTSIPFAKAVFTSLGMLEGGVRAADEIGDAFFSALKPIAEDAALGGVRTVQRIIKTLDNLPSDVLAALKNSGKFDEAMDGLARAIHHGGLDPDTAQRILTNTFFGPAYAQAEACIELGMIARAPGFPALAKRLRSRAPQNFGTLYELQVAAHFAVDGGANLTYVSKFVRADPTHVPPVTQTDIDLIIAGVYYQVKRNAGAFLSGVSEDAAVKKTWVWIQKARNDGASSVKFVTQPGVQIPSKLEALLNSEQIEIVRIPGS